ncbi:MAG: T9SS type A sorting domain-containing protein [Dysgonamonadaceae bacterium]|nr:T9SS type A sorting domain-containing protein [Dysgonamonadaceae bacterium]
METVQILDVSGCPVRVLHAQSILNGEMTINISHLPTGVYFVKTGNIIKKIIKQ